MLGTKSPCYNCNRRHLACHDTCADYIEAKAEHDKVIKKIKNRDGIEMYKHIKDRQKYGSLQT